MHDKMQESFMLSESLRDVIDPQQLMESVDSEQDFDFLMLDGKKMELELLSVESSMNRFKMQMKIPAFKLSDCLNLVEKGGIATIDGFDFEFYGLGSQWDSKNNIITCHAALMDGER
jgi:hypothetical protein